MARPTGINNPDALQRIEGWFARRGWEPFSFQRRAWKAFREGRSGIVNVSTGAGKTYAALMGPLSELMEEGAGEGLKVLYLSPLRAMTRDIELAIREPIKDLALPCTVESRTGDTSSSQRQKQGKKAPTILVTTPESAALLLARDHAPEMFSDLRCVVVDEWHELLSTKRGTQVELLLTRLRALAPRVRIWGLSATIRNLDEALQAVVGMDQTGELVREDIPRELRIETLIPDQVDAFPWAGHLGLSMLRRLVEAIDISSSTLVFTNVRSQTERWFQAILEAKPEWAPFMGLHHGSLDRDDREATEAGLKDGSIRLVVCTSSLDLGVDFAAVEQVFQIGSPRGVARLLQRAGRSGHRPGVPSRIVCVPTHALELIEIAALQRAVDGGDMEARVPLQAPVDVLAQHMVTCALGGGFTPESLFLQVRSAYAYRELSATDFGWVLDLMTRGGHTLQRYPEFRKIEPIHGVFQVTSEKIAQLHRMNIGTIVSDSSVDVTYASGKSLGHIEEIFIGSIKPGERFIFAGKTLELVSHRALRAVVRPAKGPVTAVPRWGGGKLPITDVLSRAVRDLIASPELDSETHCVLRSASPVIQAQRELSCWPEQGELLLEVCRTREGWHLFVFPFEGRLVHEGIAAILALRLARLHKATFSYSVNDYGFELLSPVAFPWLEYLNKPLFSPDQLEHDTVETVNMAELGRYRFREVARVAMLIPQNLPGARKPARQLFTSSSLIYDVFRQYDPTNLLLQQAHREVLDRNFERGRLEATMARLFASRLVVHDTGRPSPLAFPLIVERIGARLSTEELVDRIDRMKVEYTSGGAASAAPRNRKKVERAQAPTAAESEAATSEPPARQYLLAGARLLSG